jgi:uncharacterized protein YcnI
MSWGNRASVSRALMICVAILAAVSVAGASAAHIKINPTVSTYDAREKYTMRVPNEKKVASVKIEGEFPPELDVYDFEFKPGWKIDFKKNADGKIVGATWTGTIAPYEFVEMGMLGHNPKQGGTLTWRFVQFYADGTTEQFTGPAGSFLPAPVVTLTSGK